METIINRKFSHLNTSKAAFSVNSNMLIIITCILCALICVMGLMAVTHCVWPCPQLPTTRGNTVEVVPNKCLKREIIDSLPRKVFKSGSPIAAADAATSENDKAAAECVICLAEFVEGEEVREFPGCSHVFHVECIDTWLIGSHSSSCPSCRQTLVVVGQCQTCRTGVSVVFQQQEADFLP
ncbi:RING-H2 finger protein ATL80-like [Chenopodium quinoa]|nr:RING-H2 finger protein ATL80-like [Chenopodium quinoa]